MKMWMHLSSVVRFSESLVKRFGEVQTSFVRSVSGWVSSCGQVVEGYFLCEEWVCVLL